MMTARASTDGARDTPGWGRTAVRLVGLLAGFGAVMTVVALIVSGVSGSAVASLLLGPALAALTLWLYAHVIRRVERRPVTEMASAGARSGLARGVLGGFVMVATVIGIIAAFGGYEVVDSGSVGAALAVLGGMCAVAVTEEVVFRGVLFRIVEEKSGTWVAIGASGLIFGLLHLVNPDATVWGAAAIAVEAGPMLGAAYVATRSLWLPIGLHLGWNVTLSGLFGATVSGSGEQAGLLDAHLAGPTWLTGGAFGPEASIVSVLVCSTATVLLLRLAMRRGRFVARTRSAR